MLAATAEPRQYAAVIETRVLTPQDWRMWRKLRLAALAEDPSAFGTSLAEWQERGDREARWRDRLALAGSHNLVALLDGRPAAMASGVPTDSGSVAEIISMWVEPQARGQAVGDHLICAVEDWARARGVMCLRLAVMAGNDHAIALYQRNGFKFSERNTDQSTHGEIRERLMIKRLSVSTD